MSTPQIPEITFPSGLVGEVADFILGASIRPIPEVALAGALVFCAGIFGRQYNVSGTGLNLFIILIARTGRGKEGASSGIGSLVRAVSLAMAQPFPHQGGQPASGQGLLKEVAAKKCMFIILNEFADLLAMITSKRASNADLAMRRALKDLHSKSGWRQMISGATYSDVSKNVPDTYAPALSFLGDTTPKAFYEHFNEGLISSGFLGRLLSITYSGPRLPREKIPCMDPPEWLVDKIISVIRSVSNLSVHNGVGLCIDVEMDEAASMMMDAFESEIDEEINAEEEDTAATDLLARAGLNVLRLAALVAVGRDWMGKPRISMDDVNWAVGLVERDAHRLRDGIETGAIGGDESQRHEVLRRAMIKFLDTPIAELVKKKQLSPQVAEARLMPFRYFRQFVNRQGCFDRHPLGAGKALELTMDDFIKQGLLEEISLKQKAMYHLGVATRVYVAGPQFRR